MTDQLLSSKYRRNLRTKGKKYKAVQCSAGRYHLYRCDSGKVVPMLRRTLQLIADIHDQSHAGLTEMRRAAARLLKYDAHAIKLYAFGYIQRCAVCQDTRIQREPNLSYEFTDIFEVLGSVRGDEVEYRKPSELMCSELAGISEVRFDMENCEYDCARDYYTGISAEVVEFSLQNRLPARYDSLDEIQVKLEKRRLADRYRLSKVVKCSRGTMHLWKVRTNCKSEWSRAKDSYAEYFFRIPMEN
jgi:hypothetical protein